MENWKFIAGAALLAGILSLITGIFSGSPFTVILLRMVLSSLVFGVTSIGVFALIKRFLPELLQVSEMPEAAEGIDILIPEENPHRSAEENPTQPAQEEGSETASLPLEEVEELSTVDEDDLNTGAIETEGESGEEAELLEAVGETEDGEDEVSDGEEIADSDTSIGIGTPDDILDIDQLDVGFETSVDNLDDSVQKTGGRGDSFSEAQVDSLTANQDPKVLAKAVRTFMNKDQEG